MRKLLIFGAQAFSGRLFELLVKDEPQNIFLGFVIDDKFYKDSTLLGYPIYPYSTLKKNFSQDDVEILICIGYVNMNKSREEIFTRVQNDGWKIGSYISPRSIVHSKDLGIGNLIFDGVNIGLHCKIGNGNIFYPASLMAHESKVGNFNFFAIRSSVAGGVHIGDRCFFGNNCCTKNGIEIADETLIGAGCYLSEDTQRGGGVCPAQND